MLYVVATPIGNLDDLTLRAIDVLKKCDIVCAEDTRRTRAMLSHLGIAKREIISLHAHSDKREVDRISARLRDGATVALVTDAGTPSVSDPGGDLVRAAIDLGVQVVPIPGPSAALAALSASGLASDAGFHFFGFLPRQGVARAEKIARVCESTEPTIVFESPERLKETLSELARITPNRMACVAREITKMHEEMVRGSLADLAAMDREWLGEITLVLGAHERQSEALTDDQIDARIDEELAEGAHAKVVSQRVAAWTGLPQRDIYARVVKRKQSR